MDQIPNAGLLEYEEVVADSKPATTTPRPGITGFC